MKVTKKSIKELSKLFEGDLDLALFFLKWIEHKQNATKAYQDMHPGTDYATAAVLGCRLLKKVNIDAVLQIYGLGIETYMEQLQDGIKAVRSDITGQVYPDHKTRESYHTKLGKLLGIDNEKNVVEVNVYPILGDIKAE